jgi:peptide/nickel transport system permease protein
MNGASASVGRILGDPKVRAGLVLLVFLTGLAISHPVLRDTVWAEEGLLYHPETGHDSELVHPSGWSAQHWLGTDPLGRDVFSTLTFSLRPALVVAVLAAAAVGVLSLLAGSMAAYFRGLLDQTITSLADALTLLPPAIALLVVGLDRPAFGVVDAGLLFGVSYGLGPATLVVRSRARSLMVKPFIDCSRVAGSGARRIISFDLIPHLLPYAGVQMMAAGIGALTTVAFIQYLGATDAARMSLGSMIYTAIDVQPVLPPGFGTFNLGDYSARIAWNAIASAGLAMTLIAVAFYLIATGTRDAVVPETRSR